MPLAIRQFDLTGYDLIISSSHCVAKGVITPKKSLHISYCYTPMRYIWDMYEQYFGNSKIYVKIVMKILRPVLQKWDIKTSRNVDHFITISKYIQERIKRLYNRDSIVIYPPVNTDFFDFPAVDMPERKDYYLAVSAFAPYKRIDLIIETFNENGLPLKIVGSGQEEKRLKQMAKKNIEFLGWRNDEELKSYYQSCKALVFPGEEDFGIVPVEAQSCGSPVIAYFKGGAVETIISGKTGVFFEEQTAESLTRAIATFEQMQFNSNEISEHAKIFGLKFFRENISKFIEKNLKN